MNPFDELGDMAEGEVALEAVLAAAECPVRGDHMLKSTQDACPACTPRRDPDADASSMEFFYLVHRRGDR